MSFFRAANLFLVLLISKTFVPENVVSTYKIEHTH